MNNNYWKIFTGLAFVAFAAISCWATAESLIFSLYPFPAPACWVISIGFFVVASIGTAMIVNSLNQNVFVENRGWKFVGGLLMVLVFWLLCSMPTNTHTFFYRSDINGVVSEDLSKTENYLNQLANASQKTEAIQQKKDDLSYKVYNKLTALRAEIMNPLNYGIGKKAREILDDIENILHEEIDDNSVTTVTNPTRAEEMYNWYKKKIEDILRQRLEQLDQEAQNVQNDDYTQKARSSLAEIRNAQKAIDDGSLDLYKAEHMSELTRQLGIAYSTIKTYQSFVTFSTGEDDALYTAENSISKTQSMVSVYNVWIDFLHGKYRGHGLWYWVVIAILLDMAAFIFFDITFAKRDDE